jgi:hypothetical protein
MWSRISTGSRQAQCQRARQAPEQNRCAFGAGTAEAEVVTNTSIPFTGFTAFVPCANGGAGETIVGVGGELHLLSSTVVSGNNVSFKITLSRKAQP